MSREEAPIGGRQHTNWVGLTPTWTRSNLGEQLGKVPPRQKKQEIGQHTNWVGLTPQWTRRSNLAREQSANLGKSLLGWRKKINRSGNTQTVGILAKGKREVNF